MAIITQSRSGPIAIDRSDRRLALGVAAVAVLVLAGSIALKSGLSREIARERAFYVIRVQIRGSSDRALEALMATAGPNAIRLAADHDPDAPQRVWARPPGWERLDIDTPPTLGLDHLSMTDARRVNAVMLKSAQDNPPAAPFVLRASAPERVQALTCLTAAIYYEAALEPRAGQEAVAQVVLNRMRHAGYPKSVCGVVFQGSDRPGCQFSFACDGSMARAPASWAWRNAHDVAERALDGYVMKDVGVATHYHTSWIMAWWTPTLVKVGQIGAHIFFRPTGPDGLPSAFMYAYGGGEARMSRTNLIGKPVAPAPILTQVSAPGSTLAPASAVLSGKAVMMPASTIYFERSHGLIGENGGLQTVPPMHAMIGMRAAAARAVAAAAKEQAALAAQQAAAGKAPSSAE